MAGILGKIQGLLDKPITQGILAAAGTGFNPALGLLFAPVIKNDRDRRAQEMESQRLDIESKQRNIEAFDKQQSDIASLVGLLNTSPQSPGEADANRKNILGIATRLNPQAAVGGILDSAFPGPERESAAVRDARAFGFEFTPEGFERMKAAGRQGSDPEGIGILQGQLDLLFKSLQLQGLQREQAGEIKAEEDARKAREASLNSTLSKAGKISELNERLKGTFLESGSTGIGLRRNLLSGAAEVAGLFGSDASEEQKRVVSDFDTFNKLTNDFVFESLAQIENLGGVTGGKIEAIRQASAGIGVSPDANRFILRSTVETLLETADQTGIPVKDREKYKAILAGLGEARFATEEEANTAADSGLLTPGQIIFIGGRKVKFDG